MKLSQKKILVLEIISILVMLFSIFVKNFFNEWTINIFLVIAFVISIILVGFERIKVLNRRKILMMIGFYALALVILMYGLGLLVGYVKTAYSLKPLSIINNLLPVLLMIGLSEFLRFNILKKSDGSKIIFLLSILLFTTIDISVILHLYNLERLSSVLELMTVVVVPSIAKNYLLSDFSYKYGYQPCILYQLIMNVYIYIMPFFPGFDVYLESVILFLCPIAIRYLVDLTFTSEGKTDLRDKHIPSKIISSIFAIIILLLVGLYSNLFRYWIAIIGSGSMHPTIKVGDAVIIDKSYQKHLDRLEVGDVLVFKIQKTIYTHRIVNIDNQNGNYKILTKGDRKGNVQDDWIVTNDNVVGVVKKTIPKIGYPTVWLNRVLEERKNEKGK